MFDPSTGLMFEPPIGTRFNHAEAQAFATWLKHGDMGFDDPTVQHAVMKRARARQIADAAMSVYPCPFCGKPGLVRTGIGQWRCPSCRPQA